MGRIMGVGIVVNLVVLAAVIVIDWFAAKTMYEIAVMKGHAQRKYFWWCFWLAAAGYLMVIALPDRRGAQAQGVSGMDGLPEL